MNDKQKLIALIALSEQTFDHEAFCDTLKQHKGGFVMSYDNSDAWYRVIFRRNPFRWALLDRGHKK